MSIGAVIVVQAVLLATMMQGVRAAERPAQGAVRLLGDPVRACRQATAQEQADFAAMVGLARRDLPHTLALHRIRDYVQDHPRAPWSPALTVQLARVYRSRGFVDRAVALLERALAVDADAGSRPELVVELASLRSWAGDAQMAQQMVRDLPQVDHRLGDRRAAIARRAALAEHDSGKVEWSGAYSLSWLVTPADTPQNFTEVANSIRHILIARGAYGAAGRPASNLRGMMEIAETLGFEAIAGRRPAGSSLPLPALIHWRIGHWSAALKVVKGGYVMRDFLPDVIQREEWIAERAAIDEDGSGLVVIPGRELPAGWVVPTNDEFTNTTGR